MRRTNKYTCHSHQLPRLSIVTRENAMTSPIISPKDTCQHTSQLLSVPTGLLVVSACLIGRWLIRFRPELHTAAPKHDSDIRIDYDLLSLSFPREHHCHKFDLFYSITGLPNNGPNRYGSVVNSMAQYAQYRGWTLKHWPIQFEVSHLYMRGLGAILP